MNKKLSAAEVLKEAAILTAAVAIIAAAVYFFLVPRIWSEDRLYERDAAGVSGAF